MQRDIFLLNRRTFELRLSVVLGCTDRKAKNITSDSVIPSSFSETKGGRKLEQLFQLRIFAVGGGVSENVFGLGEGRLLTENVTTKNQTKI